MFIVVCYDISDDRRRTRLHKRLKDFGMPVQFSIFECDLTNKQINKLKKAVHNIIKKDDDVRYYYLCRACAAKIESSYSSSVNYGSTIIVGNLESQPLMAASDFVNVGEYSLMARVSDKDNLRAAWKKVNSNRGCAGVDWVTLNKFAKKLNSNLAKLQTALLNGTYKPLPVKQVFIPKSNGGRRRLGIPTVRDRLAQQAVYQVIGPIWDSDFSDASFAYRPGRSVGKAIKAIAKLRDHGYIWVVDADINNYFENINHDLLLKMVETKIKDKHILSLIDAWLKAQVFDGKRLAERLRGTPQGGVISPLLSNIYLDYMDKKLLNDNYRLIRYADDFVILCNDKELAKSAVKKVIDILDDLKLTLNKEKTSITNFKQGFEFLGSLFVGRLKLPGKKARDKLKYRWRLPKKRKY